ADPAARLELPPRDFSGRHPTPALDRDGHRSPPLARADLGDINGGRACLCRVLAPAVSPLRYRYLHPALGPRRRALDPHDVRVLPAALRHREQRRGGRRGAGSPLVVPRGGAPWLPLPSCAGTARETVRQDLPEKLL